MTADITFLIVMATTIVQLLILCGGVILSVLVVWLVIYLLGGSRYLLGGSREEPR